MGKTIPLRTPSLRAKARKVVRQIETSCSPDPIMRRPCADREEKRGPAGATDPDRMTDQEQLDRNYPNQRRLLVLLCHKSDGDEVGVAMAAYRCWQHGQRGS